jgi:hypothetical protein
MQEDEGMMNFAVYKVKIMDFLEDFQDASQN